MHTCGVAAEEHLQATTSLVTANPHPGLRAWWDVVKLISAAAAGLDDMFNHVANA